MVQMAKVFCLPLLYDKVDMIALDAEFADPFAADMLTFDNRGRLG